ncbi:MAG: hypothetical protein AAF357_19640, partial [Verrucomicrobiota bacterium]
VLETIGVSEEIPSLDVLNKVDMANEGASAALYGENSETPRLAVSALTGTGCDELLELIDQTVYPNSEKVRLSLSHRDGAAISWLYDHCIVDSRQDTGERIEIVVHLTPKEYEQFKKAFPDV